MPLTPWIWATSAPFRLQNRYTPLPVPDNKPGCKLFPLKQQDVVGQFDFQEMWVLWTKWAMSHENGYEDLCRCHILKEGLGGSSSAKPSLGMIPTIELYVRSCTEFRECACQFRACALTESWNMCASTSRFGMREVQQHFGWFFFVMTATKIFRSVISWRGSNVWTSCQLLTGVD